MENYFIYEKYQPYSATFYTSTGVSTQNSALGSINKNESDFQNSIKLASGTCGGCLMDAIGISAAFEEIENGIMVSSHKGELKLISKVGAKFSRFC